MVNTYEIEFLKQLGHRQYDIVDNYNDASLFSIEDAIDILKNYSGDHEIAIMADASNQWIIIVLKGYHNE